MTRLLSMMVLMMVAFMLIASDTASSKQQKVPPLPGITIAHIGDPTGGGKYVKNAVIAPAAHYSLVGVPSSWIYVEITSLDAGNNYYWGDAAQAFVGGGTVYFGSCNPLPPGNYQCMIYSQDWPASDTVTFLVQN